ncbi:MAG TPA: TolC family protein [Bryobacteraceae bacterium]|nr:TolC family protein [Bryobacteraceae bacterium]
MRSIVLIVAGSIAWVGQLSAQPVMHLTLVEAERQALQNNPQFSAAKYNAAAAYQVPNQYKAAYQPNLSGNFTGVGADSGSRLAAGALNNPVVYDRVGSGLSMNQMITDFGRTSNLVATAKLRAESQDQVTETTRAQILLATGRAYFNLLRAQSVLHVANETVNARQLVVEQISALAASKLRSTLDVTFAKVNLSDAKLLQVQAINDVQSAQADLATAMGLPGETSFQLEEESLPAPLPDKVNDLIRTAIQDRPELKDLRLQQGADERFIKAEHALFYPSIGITGTAGFVPAGEAVIPGRFGAVGMNISIPIFNGGLFRARQTEAELHAKATAQNVTDLENRVIRDVRVAYLNANTAADRMTLTKELLDQAEQSLDLAKTRFDAGLGTIVELSQAQLNLTSAQIANTTAKYDYQSQRMVVDFQVGALR